MKRQIYFDFFNLLEEYSKNESKIENNNIQFKYFVKKNRDLVYLQAFDRAKYSQTYQKYLEYTKKYNDIKKNYEPKIVEGEEPKIDYESFNKEINELNNTYSETLKEYDAILTEDINIELYKIAINNLPNLDQNNINFLVDIGALVDKI